MDGHREHLCSAELVMLELFRPEIVCCLYCVKFKIINVLITIKLQPILAMT